ncbi:MAG: universal stress protein [Thermoleophilia bacterium]|nr:universal stress protein [Thermoleophilia bacterium]
MIFGRILAATDGSEVALRAVELAARLAARENAELAVVTVVPVPTHIALAGNLNPRVLHNYVEKLGRDYLAPALQALAAHGVGAEVKILIGPPAEAITTEVEALAPDLVVIGRGSRLEPGSFLLGSVSSRVAQHARAPVLLVP